MSATPTPTIPAGMVAVPVEPTEAMMAAGAEVWLGQGYKNAGTEWRSYCRQTYRAMLAAAPKQAEQQGVERDVIERCAKIARIHGATLDLAHGHEDAEGQEDRWYEGGKSAARAIADEIAALNAPTGAVEKERGA